MFSMMLIYEGGIPRCVDYTYMHTVTLKFIYKINQMLFKFNMTYDKSVIYCYMRVGYLLKLIKHVYVGYNYSFV